MVEGWAVALLRARADVEPDAADIAALRDEIGRARSLDLTESFQRALYGRHRVTVNQQAIQALFPSQSP